MPVEAPVAPSASGAPGDSGGTGTGAPGAATASRPPSWWLRRVGAFTLLTLAALVIVFPIYVTLLNAFLPADRILSGTSLLPQPAFMTLSGFADAWSTGNMGRFMVNSAVMALLITAGQVLTSVLSGYAFAVLRFPGRSALFVLFLATFMVPIEVTLLVNVGTISSLGWTDTYQGLVAPFLATALGTFLLRQAFLGLPKELSDAASLDGFGHLGFLFRVGVPLVRPAIAALAVFSFLLAWNQYLWPLLVTNADEFRTVQIGLKQLYGQNIDSLNVVFAGTVIAVLPIFILLIAFQKQLVRGLTAGAVKG